MGTPLSTDVSAGDDIRASHHNNKRADMLNANLPATTRYASYSFASFTPYDGAMDYVYNPINAANMIYLGATGPHFFYSPVSLPHGITVSNLNMVYWKINGANAVILKLYRRTHSTGAVEEMASINGGAPAGYYNESDSSISYAVVDNENYAYYMSLFFNVVVINTVGFLMARITYSTDIALP